MVLQNHKGNEYQTQNLDHLGLVAAQFDELGLVDLINEAVPQDEEKRNVSLGHAIKSMVINGLGFSNHTLYLMPEFYEDKPVERLIGRGIVASDINQNLLGRCLDDIYLTFRTYSVRKFRIIPQPLTGTRNVSKATLGHL